MQPRISLCPGHCSRDCFTKNLENANWHWAILMRGVPFLSWRKVFRRHLMRCRSDWKICNCYIDLKTMTCLKLARPLRRFKREILFSEMLRFSLLMNMRQHSALPACRRDWVASGLFHSWRGDATEAVCRIGTAWRPEAGFPLPMARRRIRRRSTADTRKARHRDGAFRRHVIALDSERPPASAG